MAHAPQPSLHSREGAADSADAVVSNTPGEPRHSQTHNVAHEHRDADRSGQCRAGSGAQGSFAASASAQSGDFAASQQRLPAFFGRVKSFGINGSANASEAHRSTQPGGLGSSRGMTPSQQSEHLFGAISPDVASASQAASVHRSAASRKASSRAASRYSARGQDGALTPSSVGATTPQPSVPDVPSLPSMPRAPHGLNSEELSMMLGAAGTSQRNERSDDGTGDGKSSSVDDAAAQHHGYAHSRGASATGTGSRQREQTEHSASPTPSRSLAPFSARAHSDNDAADASPQPARKGSDAAASPDAATGEHHGSAEVHSGEAAMDQPDGDDAAWHDTTVHSNAMYASSNYTPEAMAQLQAQLKQVLLASL